MIGVFPGINKFEGFFNDSDREKLCECGIELAKTSVDAMYESNFEIYNILLSPSQMLYLSYVSQNKDGKTPIIYSNYKRNFYITTSRTLTIS